MKGLMVIRSVALVILLSCCGGGLAISQEHMNVLQTLIENMNLYGVSQPWSTLFVHFDKNVYTNNENVWFTGYTVKNTIDLDQYNTLSIALIRNDDRSILSEDKFLMSKGLAFGNIFLPD